MPRSLRLPRADGSLATYTASTPAPLPAAAGPIKSRIAYAAVHVAADARADSNPWLDSSVDWEATLAFRRHIYGLGLAVAEAMDTAQRGMGLGWPEALELIRRTLLETRDIPHALIFSGWARIRSSRAMRVYLQPQPESPCVFTRDLTEPIYCPVAHGEGKFVPQDTAALTNLESRGGVALRYLNPTGQPTAYPWNPNGSVANIAGVCNPSGTIFAA